MTVSMVVLTVVIVTALYWVSAYRLVFGVARLQTWSLSQGAKRGGVWEQRALDFCASRILVWCARLALPRQRIESWWHQVMTSQLQRQTEVFVEVFEGITPLPRSLDMQTLVNLHLQHRALDIHEQELALLSLHNDRIAFDLDVTRAQAEVQASLLIATTQFEQAREAIAYFGYPTWPTHADYLVLSGLSPLGEMLATIE